MPFDLDDRRNYYRASAHTAPTHGALNENIKCDVAVLGGGFTGLSTALELAEAGYSVVLLEAETIGFGASGRNGGQLVAAQNRSYDQMKDAIGEERAKVAFDIGMQAPAFVGERVKKYNIDCDLKWGYLHVAERKSHVEELHEHREEWAKLGYEETEFLDGDALKNALDSDAYFAGVRERYSGHIHPQNYCLGLAKAAKQAGVQIFENSRVEKIDTGEKPALITARARVDADYLVLGGNAYLRDVQPYLYRRIMPVGSYILATEPLGENRAHGLIPGDEAVCNLNFIVDYYRLSGDKRMLFGGRATYSGVEPGNLENFVKPRMLRIFPQLADTKIDYVWGGKIGITVDRLPHIGRIGTRTYFAQGYSGHGVALSNLCGKLIADAIRGQAEKFDVMAKFKHTAFPGGRFRTPLLTLGMFWYRLRDALS